LPSTEEESGGGRRRRGGLGGRRSRHECTRNEGRVGQAGNREQIGAEKAGGTHCYKNKQGRGVDKRETKRAEGREEGERWPRVQGPGR
jgi:hypothetical protein